VKGRYRKENEERKKAHPKKQSRSVSHRNDERTWSVDERRIRLVRDDLDGVEGRSATPLEDGKDWTGELEGQGEEDGLRVVKADSDLGVYESEVALVSVNERDGGGDALVTGHFFSQAVISCWNEATKALR
jgi:hypothetical protein